MTLYDEIAEQYDRIVGTNQRIEPAAGFCRWLVGLVAPAQHDPAESRPPAVIDAACGTGLYARELGRLGAKVQAADLSDRMIRTARARTEDADGDIRYVRASMEALDEAIDGPADAVLCMGNSLPHLLTEEALDAALDRFARLVRPGGAMAAQLLNYEPIIETGRRIVGVARLDDREFIRFYDFLADDLLRFNVLMLRWDGDDCETAIHETPLRPWRADQLAAAIERAGFEPPATYGSLDRGPFDPSTSEGLVLVARRAG